MQIIEYAGGSNSSTSLKEQLVMAVAQGNEMVAEELRMLLKLTRDNSLRGRSLEQRCGKR